VVEEAGVTREFRRHHYTCPHGRPEGVHRLDVFFDYSAFPVWGQALVPARDGRPARVVHGMARPAPLGISAELAAGLQAWADWQDAHGEYGGGMPATGEEWAAHTEEGRALAGRLARETGAEVVYRFGSSGERDRDCPHCGDRHGEQDPVTTGPDSQATAAEMSGFQAPFNESHETGI
jgi:hypothetical protein